MSQLIDLVAVPEHARSLLLSENIPFVCLMGAAVFSYGNQENTFVEQSVACGCETK
jgi:hypothetical protein